MYVRTIIYSTFKQHLLSVLQQMFAFEFKEDYGEDGWKVFDPLAEFRRQVHVLMGGVCYVIFP